jgi:DNA-binding transcriptional ArsR family regulator
MDEALAPPSNREASAQGRGAVDALKPYLRAIGDTKRMFILHELAQAGERTVLELAEMLGLSQPLTSWHLHILKAAELVAASRRGRKVVYRLDTDRLRDWRKQFDALIS